MKGKRYVFKGRSMRRLSPILEVHPGQSFVVMDDNPEMVELFKDCLPPLFSVVAFDSNAKARPVEAKKESAQYVEALSDFSVPVKPVIEESKPVVDEQPEKIVRNLGRKIKKEKK